MKKVLGIFLALLVGASALTGCGDSGNGSSTAPSQGSTAEGSEATSANDGEAQVITLKIAHNMDFVTIPNAVIEAGNRLNERYAAEGKNITLQFETDYQRIDWTEYHNNLTFAFKTGDCADIFSMDSDVTGFINAGMLLDVSDIVTDEYVDGVFASLTSDGKVYGMPFDLPVRAIYFNKAALADIGWSEEDIAALPGKAADGSFTFEEFMDLCAEVQSKGATEYGLAHRPGYGQDFFDVMEALGGSYYDENGTLVFDETGITRFFQHIYDNANTTGITPQNLSQLGWDTINSMVGTGSTFAYYGPVYSATYVAGASGKTPEQLAEDVAFMVFPKSQYSDKPFVTAAPQTMGINSNTEYPEICKDLFKELASSSADLLALHGDTIFSLSSVKAANQDPQITNNPLLKEIGYMTEYANSVPTVDGINTYAIEMHKQIVQLELGLISPEEAVQDFKTQMGLNLEPSKIIFQ